jgi:transposase-like protein
VIVVAVRWTLRFGLSYRDVEELLAERVVEVDHVSVDRWVQRFTPLLAEAARPCRHLVADRWQVDQTYVRHGTASTGTPTTEPSMTTAGCRRGCDRCAASREP